MIKDLLAANTNTSLTTQAPDQFFEEAYEAFKIYNGTISYNGIERIFWETITFEGMSRQLCQQMQIIHAFQLLSNGWPHAEYTQTQKKKACHSRMTGECNRVTQIQVNLEKNLQKALAQGQPAVGQASGHFGWFKTEVHPGFKQGQWKNWQLLVVTTCSGRKIKTTELQNTVQPLAVTNKVASGNNVFAKNASVRHLTGIFYIYIYI